MKKMILLPVLLGALAFAVGCKEGDAEKAGKEMDKAAENTKDSLKKAGEKTGEAVKDAGEKIKDAAK